ncbi:MAG: DegT/DnrJ/EryC1/StrS family aminotransferase [Nanoarchaeota archaeon]
MKKLPLVDLKSQNRLLKNEINNALNNTIDGANFILGEEIKKFEKNYAKFCGARHCISLSSGTSALELALKVSGIMPGDEVITVPNTFIANAEAIIGVGAKPIFCEIDKQTFNIDTDLLKTLITKNTRAIMPVDLYGHPCDLDPIMELAAKHNLIVVDDACQAHGAKYKGKVIGGVAHSTAFSFYPGKNLGAFGDAGCLTTNDDEFAVKTKSLRNHGRLNDEKYKHGLIGSNYRMDELQAAILNVKLKYLEGWVNARRKVASKYREYISAKDVKHPTEAIYAKHAYHLYVIRIKKRDELRKFLNSNGISTGIHYPLPLHLQPSLEFLGYKKNNFKITEEYANTILSLPIYPELTDDDISYVSNKINDFFNDK